MTDADPNSPSLLDVIKACIAVRLTDMHVSMPGRVVSYDRANQSASVQPLLKCRRAGESGPVTETLPVIHSVPVAFQGAGGYSLSFPVSAGDTVLLVFSEQSLDRWLSGAGDIADPVDPRRFALSDAIAIPGLRPFGAALEDEPADAAVMRVPNGKELRIGSPDADDPVCRRSDLADVVSAFNTRVISHTHASSGATAVLVPPLASVTTPTCSTKVMLD